PSRARRCGRGLESFLFLLAIAAFFGPLPCPFPSNPDEDSINREWDNSANPSRLDCSFALAAGTSAVGSANEVFTGSGDPQLIRRSLTAPSVDNKLVGYFLTLSETPQARAFNGADMNENVPSA